MIGSGAGNRNRANGKRFQLALKRALEEYADDRIKRGEALNEIARLLVKDALDGDHAARMEIANRLDGKPAQQLTIDGDGEGGPVGIEKIVREVVRANP